MSHITSRSARRPYRHVDGTTRLIAPVASPEASKQAFFAEFVGTFILVFTVFGVIHRKASAAFAYVAISRTRADAIPAADIAVPSAETTAA
ncbi:hypothetical protein [Mycobacterium sp. MMS18-G62]